MYTLASSGEATAPCGRTCICLRPLAVFRYSCLQPFPNQAKYRSVGHPMLDALQGPFVIQVVEKAHYVRIEYQFTFFRWMPTVRASSA
jgi:hypothetical protein